MQIGSREAALREELVTVQCRLVSSGLTSGTSGNVSARLDDGTMLITPTGLAATDLLPERIVKTDLQGRPAPGELAPSSEWRIHADIYRGNAGVGGVVHCHSTYATILACAHRPIPAIHYMLAASGCGHVPLAAYATFGTSELSRAVLAALAEAPACLMANHGQIATAATPGKALALAELVEEVAHWYWGVLAMGATPQLLDESQMEAALAAFAAYGQQAARPDLAAGKALFESDEPNEKGG